MMSIILGGQAYLDVSRSTSEALQTLPKTHEGLSVYWSFSFHNTKEALLILATGEVDSNKSIEPLQVEVATFLPVVSFMPEKALKKADGTAVLPFGQGGFHDLAWIKPVYGYQSDVQAWRKEFLAAFQEG